MNEYELKMALFRGGLPALLIFTIYFISVGLPFWYGIIVALIFFFALLFLFYINRKYITECKKSIKTN